MKGEYPRSVGDPWSEVYPRSAGDTRSREHLWSVGSQIGESIRALLGNDEVRASVICWGSKRGRVSAICWGSVKWVENLGKNWAEYFSPSHLTISRSFWCIIELLLDPKNVCNAFINRFRSFSIKAVKEKTLTFVKRFLVENVFHWNWPLNGH